MTSVSQIEHRPCKQVERPETRASSNHLVWVQRLPYQPNIDSVPG